MMLMKAKNRNTQSCKWAICKGQGVATATAATRQAIIKWQGVQCAELKNETGRKEV